MTKKQPQTNKRSCVGFKLMLGFNSKIPSHPKKEIIMEMTQKKPSTTPHLTARKKARQKLQAELDTITTIETTITQGLKEQNTIHQATLQLGHHCHTLKTLGKTTTQIAQYFDITPTKVTQLIKNYKAEVQP
jgi:hypothetical protein